MPAYGGGGEGGTCEQGLMFPRLLLGGGKGGWCKPVSRAQRFQVVARSWLADFATPGQLIHALRVVLQQILQDCQADFLQPRRLDHLVARPLVCDVEPVPLLACFLAELGSGNVQFQVAQCCNLQSTHA